jgi:signal transduction histidine kinase
MNLSVRKKFAFGLVIILSLIIAQAAVYRRSSITVENEFNYVVSEETPILYTMGAILASVNRLVAEAASYGLFQSQLAILSEEDTPELVAETLEELEGERIELTQNIVAVQILTNQYKEALARQGELESAEQLAEAAASVSSAAQALVQATSDQAPSEEIFEKAETLEEAEGEFVTAITEIVTVKASAIATSQQQAHDSIINSQRVSMGLTGLSLLIALGLAFYWSYTILRPVTQLRDAALELQKGNTKNRVNITSKDEFGTLATSFNDAAMRLDELIKELENRVDESNTARQRAEDSDRVKSAFLASMSHELRTPLNSIINFTKFVSNGTMGDVNEQQKETLGEVITSGQHLLGLINDVLDMSKIESGSLRLFVEEDIDLAPILQSVVKSGRSLLADKPIALETELPAELPRIRADRQRVLQILLNIMSNACKFTEKGSITLIASTHNGSIEIAVKDTGPGIAAGDFEAVFEPFSQTTTGLRKGSGTGLGMPISRRLAEAHGGQLQLESTVGQGTMFRVVLPVKSANLTPVVPFTKNLA